MSLKIICLDFVSKNAESLLGNTVLERKANGYIICIDLDSMFQCCYGIISLNV